MKRTILAAAGLVALMAGAPVWAQMDHSAHGAGAASDSPSTAGYQAANETMHGSMAVEFTGDADIDFLNSMRPHHQGAIDMAKVVLEHGSDPEVKALAQKVIAAQEAEIAEIDAMLLRLQK